MKRMTVVIIGGVAFQTLMILVLYLGSFFESASKALAQRLAIFWLYVSPGVVLLVPEGQRSPHHWLRVLMACGLNIVLYSSVLYLASWFWGQVTHSRRDQYTPR